MPTNHSTQSLFAHEAIPVLESAPAILRSLLAPLPTAWHDFQEDPQAWTPRMVLVHFIHNERTNWIPRARIILSSEAERRFLPFQQMPNPGEIDDRNVASMLSQFAALREENLGILRAFGLGPKDYLRTGEHPALGTVTLGQLLATWVVHDLNHTHQILKSLAKLNANAVGPWRPNLAILDL